MIKSNAHKAGSMTSHELGRMLLSMRDLFITFSMSRGSYNIHSRAVYNITTEHNLLEDSIQILLETGKPMECNGNGLCVKETCPNADEHWRWCISDEAQSMTKKQWAALKAKRLRLQCKDTHKRRGAKKAPDSKKTK